MSIQKNLSQVGRVIYKCHETPDASPGICLVGAAAFLELLYGGGWGR